MKNLTISFEFSDEGGLKELTFLNNDLDQLPDSKLLKNLAMCILKTIDANQQDVQVHDLLVELDIQKG